ncbi:protein translocase subunit TIM13 KNAG_0H02610 [Huiozyma naganishii CBS 8797]|uniref:Mitochondrial import inner membrane translocase subunit n=1 Tax=Huiozyma naganishii (strain ATCC MYA-139 / BCRC 22969 / CBS 8797 / KCTC 17520 / NBRC 10181 / NCYC 3082 / Yp74L-3) TaxID=1071383 RepID=J7S9S4_HUIN7|nr:hypothetical protein KNAG_0H02610 [Kazachstania naganishii CBS 8797]CCK71676.1 hypothetical protein KNAG_0H02610 [Kazachstania naganishii CBS 8797]
MGLFSREKSNENAAPAVSQGDSKITDQLKGQIKQEIAVANATELVSKASESCFNLCLQKPYNTNNDTCIDQCLAKYLRSWNIISKTYVSRIQEAANAGEI